LRALPKSICTYACNSPSSPYDLKQRKYLKQMPKAYAPGTLISGVCKMLHTSDSRTSIPKATAIVRT
jgi:hypothetical protein